METTVKISPAASLAKKIFRVAGKSISVFTLALIFVLVFFLLQSRLAGGVPAVAGYQIYIVLSGSMSPAFETGSIVLVRPLEASAIRPGEIITYRDPENQEMIVTHRVIAVNTAAGSENPESFTTRGDANDAKDLLPVPAGNLLGRVSYTVPYLGFLFSFINTQDGILLFIIIPALLIIVLELRKLFSYATALEKQKKGGVNG
ncbi:MAG: Signal peptidase I W [Syntrophomonadaceae bacterium]|nr:Signal peptidase I W [Bacillota bacterium]